MKSSQSNYRSPIQVSRGLTFDAASLPPGGIRGTGELYAVLQKSGLPDRFVMEGPED
jgi:hypothetical protein